MVPKKTIMVSYITESANNSRNSSIGKIKGSPASNIFSPVKTLFTYILQFEKQLFTFWREKNNNVTSNSIIVPVLLSTSKCHNNGIKILVHANKCLYKVQTIKHL